jgi:hypothetical protein
VLALFGVSMSVIALQNALDDQEFAYRWTLTAATALPVMLPLAAMTSCLLVGASAVVERGRFLSVDRLLVLIVGVMTAFYLLVAGADLVEAVVDPGTNFSFGGDDAANVVFSLVLAVVPAAASLRIGARHRQGRTNGPADPSPRVTGVHSTWSAITVGLLAVVAVALPVRGRHDAQSRADRFGTEGTEAPACPAPGGDADTQWLISTCERVRLMGLITAVEIVPAVTGANASSPDGDGYDWDSLAKGCTDLDTRAGELSVQLGGAAPAQFRRLAERLTDIAHTAQSFATQCAVIAPTHDYDAMRHIAPLALEAAQIIAELQSEFADLTDS